jgi:hypothetical protein
MVTMAADVSPERARAVLAVHIDWDGLCEGCLTCWARLAPFPCAHARSARLVLASCTGQPADDEPINLGSVLDDRQ